jgi:spermidine synthase
MDAMTMRLPAPKLTLLCAMLFCSGLASLVFQVVWLRGFAIILGSTIYSMSCVITVFMLGLALGSAIMARGLRRASVRVHPLIAYGVIELTAGVLSLVVSWALFRKQGVLLPLTAGASAPFALRMASQFGLCLALIGVPTMLMGMTLPWVSLLVGDPRQIPTLYGFNTIGAAAGSVVASFVLIYQFGSIAAAAAAAVVDVGVFIASLASRRRFEVATAGEGALSDDAQGDGGLSVPLMLALAAFSGFVALTCEITWTRFLSLCFGNRVYVTSITLAVVLLFMGQAARMSAGFLKAGRPPWRILLSACVLSLISLGVGLQLEHVAFLGARREWVVAFLLTMVVFPTTTLGLLFPMTLAVRSGAWVGRAYAVNTLASVMGSLTGGYVLMGRVGSNGIVAIDATLVAVATVAMGVAYRHRLKGRDWAAIAVAAGSFAALVVPNARLVPPLYDPANVVVSSEDANGIFNVVRAGEGRLRVVNNRTDLVYLFGDPVTQYVQESQAYLPSLYAPRLDRVLNIGAGYGITAGAFIAIDEVAHVDAVEIVPAMVENAGLFSSGNRNYFHHPRVRVVVEDGRYFLATRPERYDIISVNVSDPYLPGATSVFSREFYELVRTRLSPGGVLAQHIFGPDIASLYRGLAGVFPYVKAIPSYDNGLTVVAGLEPLEQHQRELFDHRYEGGRMLLAPIGLENGLADMDRLLAMGDARIASLRSETEWFENSDVRPYLEFRRIPGKLGLFYTHN